MRRLQLSPSQAGKVRSFSILASMLAITFPLQAQTSGALSGLMTTVYVVMAVVLLILFVMITLLSQGKQNRKTASMLGPLKPVLILTLFAALGLGGFVQYKAYQSSSPQLAVAEEAAPESAAQPTATRAVATGGSQPTIQLASLTPVSSEAELAEGKKTFEKACMACHAMDGGGGVGPNLTDEHWIHGPQMSDLMRIITHGVIEKGMAPWGGQLSAQEIRQVASYVLSLQGSQPAKPKDPQGLPYAKGRPAFEEWAYVSNEDAGSISIVDLVSQKVVETIPVGKRPRGIKVSPDGLKVFVALSGSPKCPPWEDEEACEAKKVDKSADGIAVIDVLTKKVERTLPGGSDPEQFDLSPDGKRLYVANEDAGLASVIDVASGDIIKEIEVGGEPEGVKVNPDGSLVYVTSEEEHTVAVIDAESLELITRIKVGKRPRDVVFTSDGTRAFVSGEHDQTVSEIDVANNKVVHTYTLPEGTFPMNVVLAPDEQKLYVSTGRGKYLMAIDLDAQQLIDSVAVGKRPWGLATTGDGKYLISANGPDGNVSLVDAVTFKVVKTLNTADGAWGIATGPSEKALGGGGPDPEVLKAEFASIVAKGDAEKGQKLFNGLYGCSHCHGTNAVGHNDNRALRNIVDRYGLDGSQVVDDVLQNGRDGTAMPPWGHLPAKKLADLKAYIFSIQDI